MVKSKLGMVMSKLGSGKSIREMVIFQTSSVIFKPDMRKSKLDIGESKPSMVKSKLGMG